MPSAVKDDENRIVFNCNTCTEIAADKHVLAVFGNNLVIQLSRQAVNFILAFAMPYRKQAKRFHRFVRRWAWAQLRHNNFCGYRGRIGRDFKSSTVGGRDRDKFDIPENLGTTTMPPDVDRLLLLFPIILIVLVVLARTLSQRPGRQRKRRRGGRRKRGEEGLVAAAAAAAAAAGREEGAEGSGEEIARDRGEEELAAAGRGSLLYQVPSPKQRGLAGGHGLQANQRCDRQITMAHAQPVGVISLHRDWRTPNLFPGQRSTRSLGRVPMARGHKDKTAFIAPNDQYWNLRMPQGMTGSIYGLCARRSFQLQCLPYMSSEGKERGMVCLKRRDLCGTSWMANPGNDNISRRACGADCRSVVENSVLDNGFSDWEREITEVHIPHKSRC
ncbi:uncharacterized protein B0T23DRAFT_433772 [Neurospora hispaniola]|uniref:Uncharacterized protein n=1 Tax=Neurospora hispaniola TaxID=588809 RepID=A0AAJ0IEM0_9PEZI|nr:hypothetical protein B0T23DRAFT_433772 [Neurospora hispaniola]